MKGIDRPAMRKRMPGGFNLKTRNIDLPVVEPVRGNENPFVHATGTISTCGDGGTYATLAAVDTSIVFLQLCGFLKSSGLNRKRYERGFCELSLSQMTTQDTTVRKLQMKVPTLLMAVAGLFAVHAANVPSGAYYLGTPDAAHAHATRRHEGIPSMARDPATGRLWAVWYGGVTPCEDSNNYLMIATN